jgi:large subunit ribosomal protein L13
MSLAEFDPDAVVDSQDCILGRVSSKVAERAMDGERIAIVNAERAVITGGTEDVMSVYKDRVRVGSDRGIFKRAVRGMLPYKTTRGREALENVRVYVGNPFDADEEVLGDTSIDRLSKIKFVSLGEISDQLGANVTW